MKGATDGELVEADCHVISIHAPVKGATVQSAVKALGLPISIHAPVKGATELLWFEFCGHGDFNPRSREGSDCSMIHPLTNIWSAFNSKRVPTAEPTYTDSVSSRAIEIMPQIDNITI